MANNRFNKQSTPKGYKAGGRTGKMGGGMMMKRPMMKKGGKTKLGSDLSKLGSTDYGIKKLKKGMMDKYQKRQKFDKEVDLDKVLKSSKVRRARSEAQGMRKDRIKEGIKRRLKEGTGNFKTYKASTEAMAGNVFKAGGRIKKKMGGSLKPVNPKTQKGLSKLPTEVRNKMGYMKKGGKVHGK